MSITTCAWTSRSGDGNHQAHSEPTDSIKCANSWQPQSHARAYSLASSCYRGIGECELNNLNAEQTVSLSYVKPLSKL
jgi:hypothetical protein